MLAIGAFTSCGSDDDVNNGTTTGLTSGRITLSVEDYGADQNVTRSALNAGADQTETVDLGDGLRAEVSVKQDAPQAAAQSAGTRAGMSNGHYTIYAVDNATNTRVTGPNSLLKGTVTAGNFTPDAGSRMKLNPGSYTFVCFNDAAVTDNGSALEVQNGADALIGTTTQTISGNDWNVNFQMKRQAARVRFKVVAYSPATSGLTGNVSFTGTQPTTHTYAPKADSYTATASGAFTSGAYTVSPTGATDAWYIKANAFYTDYRYLLPGVSAAGRTLTFTAGTTYGGVSLAGKSLTLPSTLAAFARNGSYTIQVKLLPVVYLFNDGTNGVLAEKGSRIPVGIVLKERNPTEAGRAMALKEAGGGAYALYDGNYDDTHPSTHVQNNDVQITDYNTALNDMNGYHYTWDTSGSADGVTQKALSPRYQAFRLAAEYGNKLAAEGVSIPVYMAWYLPAAGEWMLLTKMFPGGSNPNGSGWGVCDATLNTPALFNALTAAGGEDLVTFHTYGPSSTGIGGYYWTSTEYSNQSPVTFRWSGSAPNWTTGISNYSYKSYPQNNVRAFALFF